MLPFYWIRKNPTEATFVIEAPKCSSEILSKSITFVFKLMFKEIEGYNKQSFFLSNGNPMWKIFNNQLVIDTIKNWNGSDKDIPIAFYNFLTLSIFIISKIK